MGPIKKFHSLSELAEVNQSQSPEQIAPAAQNRIHDGKGKTVRLLLDTHGRKGKSVTMVSGLHHNPATMEELARMLKQYCGSGGTVKDGNIELQGDQRARAATKLKELNYIVK
ncbi:MAG: translation initiation factor [Ignavibacteriae bacterium]|nr:MAG: translation initiation factor [Ignavibacteriota bacterium]